MAVKGKLPKRALALVLEWAVLHRNELDLNWQRARRGYTLKPIEPLKKNYELFKTLRVDKTLGTIVWENGAAIDPDVLLGKNVRQIL